MGQVVKKMAPLIDGFLTGRIAVCESHTNEDMSQVIRETGICPSRQMLQGIFDAHEGAGMDGFNSLRSFFRIAGAMHFDKSFSLLSVLLGQIVLLVLRCKEKLN